MVLGYFRDGAPFVRAVIQVGERADGANSLAALEFLVDTGAETTTLMPVHWLQIDPGLWESSTACDPVVTGGGQVDVRESSLVLTFLDENGLTESVPIRAHLFPETEAALRFSFSLLGRDVINLTQLTLNSQRNDVAFDFESSTPPPAAVDVLR